MKNKKAYILIAFIALLMPVVVVFAHPGSLDSNGGHWDRKEGTYHFHEGKNTGGSSSSSSYQEYEPFTPPYEPPTDNPYRSNGTDAALTNTITGFSARDWVMSIIVTIFMLLIIISSFYDDAVHLSCLVSLFMLALICTEKIYLYVFLCEIAIVLVVCVAVYVVSQKKANVENSITDVWSVIRKEEKCVSDIDKAVKYILAPPKITNIPFFIEITDNGLSARNKSKAVSTVVNGKKLRTPFVYYVSSKGRCFHTKKGCSNSKIKLNVFNDIVMINTMLPCKKCASKLDTTVLNSILECYTSFMDCKKYEQNKNRYLAEIKSNRCKLTTLSQTKTDLLKKLKTKEKYIKKSNELSKKYDNLLNYIDEHVIIVCDEIGQYNFNI